LQAEQATREDSFGFADEMRLGLHGHRRRVWFGCGVKLRQRLEMQFVWKWLCLAVDSVSGKIVWSWQETMKCDSMQKSLRVFGESGMKHIVWDNAPSHRSKVLRDTVPHLHFLPAFSPELNPAERVFEEVRRHVEGKVWVSLDAKMAAVELYLTSLVQDEDRLKRLVCWDWIRESVKCLPERRTDQMAQIK
jgi:DDE superfamily endonuclease